MSYAPRALQDARFLIPAEKKLKSRRQYNVLIYNQPTTAIEAQKQRQLTYKTTKRDQGHL